MQEKKEPNGDEIPLADDTITLDREKETLLPILPLSWRGALFKVGIFSLPYLTSRLAFSANLIGNGIIIPKIGDNAEKAAAQMFNIFFAILNPGRGIVQSTSIIIGTLHGQSLLKIKENNPKAALALQKEIGHVNKQAIAMGIIQGVPLMTLLLSMKYILKAAGLPEPVANEIQKYLNGATPGLIPLFWTTSDQMFALATGRKYLPLMVGSLYAALSMMIGYTLALGKGPLPAMGGVAGLGIGMSVSAWISFITTRIYFTRKEFKPYALYKVRGRDFFKNFSEILKIGIPLSAQALSEWGDLMLLSVLIALISSESAIASFSSFQITSIMNSFSSALIQSTTVMISNMIGEIPDEHEKAMIQNNNIKKTGYAAIVINLTLNLFVSSLLITIPRTINSVFLSETHLQNPKVITLANTMLQITGGSMAINAIRTISSAALAGGKDVIFAPVTSFMSMTVLGLTIATILSEIVGLDADWVFITRTISILLAATLIMQRWRTKDYTHENTMVIGEERSTLTSVGKNKFSWWRTKETSTETNIMFLDENCDYQNK